MKKFFIFIFLFYATNSISADYNFEFNGSWLLKDRSDQELASGKILADFHDMHVIYYGMGVFIWCFLISIRDY